MDEHRAANRANWDDRVPIHRTSREYSADEFIANPSKISDVVAFDSKYLGDVTGKTLLHLQCHFGRDTLSWASLGADVTGVDFSEPAISEAQRLSADSGVPGRFIVSELYDSPNMLDEQFDIVYSGVGALNWLPDLDGWAGVVNHFLKPGGTFYIREGHPVIWALDYERDDDLYVISEAYFNIDRPLQWDSDETYTDGDLSVEHTRTYEWNHGLSAISALIKAGLTITHFEEHDTLEWPALPSMVRGEDDLYRMSHHPERVPLMYSLAATK